MSLPMLENHMAIGEEASQRCEFCGGRDDGSCEECSKVACFHCLDEDGYCEACAEKIAEESSADSD